METNKKMIPVEAAVGSVLCHDLTQIVPGVFKGRLFRRGHVIHDQDIPLLLDIGKRHLFVLDLESGMLHEDEAAQRMARAAAGGGLTISEPCEGRVNLKAEKAGLLKINTDALQAINSLGGIAFATIHSGHRVAAQSPVAGVRVIPLTVEEEIIVQVEEICQEHWPLIEIKPFKPWRVGMITTGSEVFQGRIKDKFGPVVKKKFAELGSTVFRQILVDDDQDMTKAAIHELLAEGAQMVVLTGGMSVDPDDLTPASIRAAGAEVVTYGAPTFPGAMFMLAYLDDIPLLGLPGCVMYHRTTIFDLVVPRLLAGETISRQDIVALGHGGFCLNCSECRYPLCGFGKV
jgi:molybdenum cofactor synthesis domain-containing protein